MSRSFDKCRHGYSEQSIKMFRLAGNSFRDDPTSRADDVVVGADRRTPFSPHVGFVVEVVELPRLSGSAGERRFVGCDRRFSGAREVDEAHTSRSRVVKRSRKEVLAWSALLRSEDQEGPPSLESEVVLLISVGRRDVGSLTSNRQTFDCVKLDDRRHRPKVHAP